MTEGKGYCARRQERISTKKLAKLIEDINNIVIVPDIPKKSKRN